MTIVPTMWAVWGVFVLILIGFKIYSIRLTRDEDDQLVLTDGFEHLRVEQAAIAAKVHKIQPLRTTAMWLAVAATIFVAGYYAMDVMAQFR